MEALSPLSLPSSLLVSPVGEPIRVGVQEQIVFKAYYPEASDKAIEKYCREIDAFNFFHSQNVSFVPRLLACGVENSVHWHATEFSGKTLVDWCANASAEAMGNLLDQLIEIDAWLYKHRVNYLEASPRDILVDAEGRAKIIDFEYTFLDEMFEQLLIERIDHDRLILIEPDCRTLVRREIISHRSRSYKFLRRKIVNSIMLRLGCSRVQKSIRPR